MTTVPQILGALSGPASPPPPPGYTNIVEAVAQFAGPTSFRIKLPPGYLAAGGAASVRVGGVDGQVDNVTELYGWVLGLTVSVILPTSGQKVVAVSPTTSSFTQLSYPTEPTITIDGVGPTGDYVPPGGPYGDWRNGAVCRERIYAKSFANNLRVMIHQSVWATTPTPFVTTRLVYEYGLSIPGVSMDGATTRSYTTTATLGTDTFTYVVNKSGGNGSTYFDTLEHLAGSRWTRDLGNWHNDTQVVPLGWVGSPDDGTWEYAQWSGIISRWQAGVSPGSLAGLTVALNSVANVPFPAARNTNNGTVYPGVTSPSTFPWDGGSGIGDIGPFSASQGAPGGNNDIAQIPIYCFQALRALGSGGFNMLRGTGRLRQGCPDAYIRSKATGLIHTCNEGRNYTFNPSADRIGFRLDPSLLYASQVWEPSHWGAMFWPIYAVTGEFLWAESQVGTELYNFCQAEARSGALSYTNPHGTGPTRHAYYQGQGYYLDTGWASSMQERWMGYSVRCTSLTMATLPSDDTKNARMLGWTAAMTNFMLEAVEESLYTAFVADPVFAPSRFPAGSARTTFVSNFDAYGLYASWMVGIQLESFQYCYDLGVMSAHGLLFYKWFVQGRVNCINDNGFEFPLPIGSGNYTLTMDGVLGSAPSTPAPNPAITPSQLYTATRNARGPAAGDWPLSGTVDPDTLLVTGDTGWAGRWLINMAGAVDLGVPGAVSAYNRIVALAQRQFGKNYFPDVFYARAPKP